MAEEPDESRRLGRSSERAAVVPAAQRSAGERDRAAEAAGGGSILALALMLEDWLPAFAGEATGAPTLHDGHRVPRVVDAARRSATGEGWVTL